jgi:hypothetical protein
MTYPKLRSLLVGAFTLALAAATTAQSQAPETQQEAQAPQGQQAPTSPAQGEQAQVSDQQLQQFVTAVTGVQSVQESYAQEIEAADDPADAQDLQRAAHSDMVQAVEESGLSISEYNLIAQRLQTDPTLAQRLMDMLE